MKFSVAKEVTLSDKMLQLQIGSQDTDELVRCGAYYVYSVGTKTFERASVKTLVTIFRKLGRAARDKRLPIVTLSIDELFHRKIVQTKEELTELLGVNITLSNYDHTTYRSEPKEGWPEIEELILESSDSSLLSSLQKGGVIGEEINAAREISNIPGGEMTPELLAHHAIKSAQGTAIEVEILDFDEIKKQKMGGMVGVGRGALAEPRFIVMKYMQGGKEKPTVLVGKGITFDTGGLSIKSGSGMLEMHMDMSGGASVIHTIVLAAKLGLKKNIIALVPAAENAVSGESYRPGDVLTSMSGITIEVRNTDAEGRIVLADALHYAKQFKPKVVIDVATLTGAAMSAFGHRISAIFATDDSIAQKMVAIGKETTDYVWQMPLWNEYEDDIKGTFGDFMNTPKARADVICAATFLHQFIKGENWVHIDIAPRMTTIASDYLAKGSSGAAVHLLIKYLEGSHEN